MPIIEHKTGRKGGRLSKTRREEIEKDLREKIENNGKIQRKSILVKKYNISRPTLDAIIASVNLEYDFEGLESIDIELRLIFDKLKVRLNKLWERAIDEEDLKQELWIMKEIRETIKDFTSMLEAWGHKMKAVENINLQADVQHTFPQIEIIDNRDKVMIDVESTDN